MPFPQSLETVTWPPISRMNAQTCGSPKPVPLSPLVVKNGSNALRTTSAGMPCPLSLKSNPNVGTRRGRSGGHRSHVPSIRADFHRTALRHSVSRIDNKVQNCGTELCRINEAFWDGLM